MTDASKLAFLGQDNGGGTFSATYATQNALFKSVFAGLVTRAYEQQRKLFPLITSRTVRNARGVNFPLMGGASASFHTPGESIISSADAAGTDYLSNIKVANKEVKLNDLLIASCMTDKLDELKNEFDARADLAAELGRVLADKEDELIFRALYASATRTADLYTGEPDEGGTVEIELYGSGGTTPQAFDTVASNLLDGLFAAASALDQRNVPENDRYFVIDPEWFHYLSGNTTVLNRDWGGSGALADNKVFRVAGFDVVKSANIPRTDISAEAGENSGTEGLFLHDDGGINIMGMCFHKGAAACAKAMDVGVETSWMPEYQGHLLAAKVAAGYDSLRREGAVAISGIQTS
jgi:hypothetical protein